MPAAAKRWTSVLLMLVLAFQGTAAVMQRLKPAHYHVQVTSHSDSSTSHSDHREGRAHAGVDRENSRGHGHRHGHEHVSNHVVATTPDTTAVRTHRHGDVERHVHASDDRSVVNVGDADAPVPVLGGGKQSFDSFVLALPPTGLRTDRRDTGAWDPASVPGHPSHRTRPPERPPRFS